MLSNSQRLNTVLFNNHFWELGQKEPLEAHYNRAQSQCNGPHIHKMWKCVPYNKLQNTEDHPFFIQSEWQTGSLDWGYTRYLHWSKHIMLWTTMTKFGVHRRFITSDCKLIWYCYIFSVGSVGCDWWWYWMFDNGRKSSSQMQDSLWEHWHCGTLIFSRNKLVIFFLILVNYLYVASLKLRHVDGDEAKT